MSQEITTANEQELTDNLQVIALEERLEMVQSAELSDTVISCCFDS